MDNKYVNKALELSSKVASNVYLDAISKGLMGTLPILIIGSIGCLLGVFPFDPYLQFIEKIGVKTYFLTASTVTTSCLSIYAAFLIGYRLAGSFKCDQIPAGLISVFAFFITTPLTKDSGLMMEFMGAKGLFGAMIANTFTALIPAILVGLIFIVVATIFSFTPYGSFTQLVYTVIVTPLNSLGGSVWSLVVLILVQMLLWFFGIHGSNVISGVITAVYLPMATANLEAYAAGKALPNILCNTFYDTFSGIGGAGGTLSLCIVILLFAKSKQNKTMGKLGIIPGLFTINEPVVFGYPLIMNPLMVIPFILTPVVQTLVAYFSMYIGLVPRFTGVQVPWCMPIILKPLLAGGWQAAILQVVCIFIGCLIWYPFFKVSDKQRYEQEQSLEATAE